MVEKVKKEIKELFDLNQQSATGQTIWNTVKAKPGQQLANFNWLSPKISQIHSSNKKQQRFDDEFRS